MKSKKVINWLVLFVVVATIGWFALTELTQTTHRIAVYDVTTSEPIPWVLVSFNPLDDDQPMPPGKTTDEAGSVEFRTNDLDQFKLRVLAEGYVHSEQDPKFHVDPNIDRAIMMQPDPEFGVRNPIIPVIDNQDSTETEETKL